MARDSTWMRFTTEDGVIYGEIIVPTVSPKWFEPVLRDLNAGAKRDITMSDVSAEEWADWCCSRNQPIPLLKPLSPQRVEESAYFRSEAAVQKYRDAVDAEITRLGGGEGKPDDVNQKALEQVNILRRDDDWSRKNGMLTVEDFDRLPDAEKKKCIPVLRSQVQPGKQTRPSIRYTPMIDQEDEDTGSFRLYPHRINHRVTMDKSHQFARMVKSTYGTAIDTAKAGSPLAGPGLQIAGHP